MAQPIHAAQNAFQSMGRSVRARDPERAAEMIDLHFADIRARIDKLPLGA